VELFNRHMRSGAATPFDVPLPYTGASGHEHSGGVRAGSWDKPPRVALGCVRDGLSFHPHGCPVPGPTRPGWASCARPNVCPHSLALHAHRVRSVCCLFLQVGGALDAMTPMTPKSVSSASSDSTDLEDDPDVAVVSHEESGCLHRGPATWKTPLSACTFTSLLVLCWIGRPSPQHSICA